MRKKSLILAAIFFASLFLIYSCKSPSSSEQPLSSSTSNTSSTSSGFIKILLTDAPLEAAKNIFVTIGQIFVHKTDSDSFVEIEIPTAELKFDLLQLKDQLLTILKEKLEVAHYNQIRMTVVAGLDKSYIVFNENGQDVSYALDVPSNEIKIPVQFKIEADVTTEVTLDFDGKNSIHIIQKKKGEDSYQLRPVIHVVKVNNSGS
jgi:hypothetical protein